MTRTRFLAAASALACALAAAGPASAATPTLSFTAIEFKNPGFMDYTDDACMGGRGVIDGH